MKQRAMLVVSLSLLAQFCMVSWGVRAQSSSRVTWEYKVVSTYGPSITNPPPNVNELNDAGLVKYLRYDHSQGLPKL